MLLAVKVMNQTNQMKTRNRNAFPRSDPNFFTATIYLHEQKNATPKNFISRPFPSVTRAHRVRRGRTREDMGLFDFPVRGRKIKTVSHFVAR
jgi:hypothetical protein